MPCWWLRGRILVAALLTGSAAAPALAQSPADRAALRSLQDSLDDINGRAGLARISRTWAGRRGPAMDRLRRGFLALATGRLSGARSDLDVALIEFDWAVSVEREWPYPWFGRALAKLALSEGRFIPKATGGQPPGRNYYQGFVADLTRAFDRDSAFPPGIQLLSRLLPPQEDRTQPAAFVRALEAAVTTGRPIDPAVHLILGRAWRTAGQDERALTAFDRFRAAGGDPGLVELERARSLAGLGHLDEAAAAYHHGLELEASGTRRVYRRDLAWIATEAELAAFDSVPPELLGRWVADFWAVRDAEALRRPGERLREHLRRWSHAHRWFRVLEPERKTDFRLAMRLEPDIGPCIESGAKSIDNLTFEDPARLDDARRRERLLDHRGVVYIRHGEPAARLAAPGARELDPEAVAAAVPLLDAAGLDDAAPFVFPTMMETPLSGHGRQEVWQYLVDGESRLLYFSGSLALGRRTPSTLYSYIPLQPTLLHRVAVIDPRYREVAYAVEGAMAGLRRGLPVACMAASSRLRRESRQAMAASVRSDSYTLLYPQPLDPIIQISAVGQPPAGTGRLLVVFAIPGERLTPQPLDDGRVRYRIGLRISAVDRTHNVIRGLDTLRAFVARDTLPAGAWLSGLVELPAPAGAYDVRVAVEEAGGEAGSTALLRGVALGAPRGTLALSDLVLGRNTGGLRWENLGDPVMLNALNAYMPGDEAPVYYEASGLVPGRSYQTTLAVRPADDEEGRGVSLLFAERAERTTMHIRRTIGLEGLAEGRYRLRVTLEDRETGERSSRERLINIVIP